MNGEEFKINDMVKVIDNGQTYTTYKDWMVANASKSQCFDFDGYVPKKNEIGRVLKVAPSICNQTALALPFPVEQILLIEVRDCFKNYHLCMISEEGVTKYY